MKTRSQRNWDADGLLAITPAKQAKLWRCAQLFLAERPDLANLPCRFDVALVSSMRLPQGSRYDDTKASGSSARQGVKPGQPVLVAGYQLRMQDYIQSAFEIE